MPSHVLMAPFQTEPALGDVMKVDKIISEAGMRLISGMLKSSQNFVK